ncbi:uncharacterized protein LOC120117765 [Hibiscus syriacus]|uniref:uncharacterized protein LOC120117765 n=1 Tax=Hibiscus syriacus TaxID=106335 RepID=UPI001924956B|nr:uncharacterized protein LOC120117765 [Hibiscus syriacus]
MDNVRRRGFSSGEEKFSNRIISRNSSVGYSSRIYYYRSSEGIPFNWEMQPVTPKEPQKEDTLPPISQPPAVLSLGLPKPRIDIVDDPKPFKLRVFKFWKQGKRSQGNNSKRLDQTDKYCSSCEMSSSDDGDFMASPPRISSSSSSSSFSFSNGSPSPSRGSSVEGHYGCSPLHFSSFRLGVSRLRLR